MLSFEFLLRLSAILKLDFLKSPGKSGSARPPRGMKLGNGAVFIMNSKIHLRKNNSNEYLKTISHYFRVYSLSVFI